MKTMKATTAPIIASTTRISTRLKLPVPSILKDWAMAAGIRATIPANIIIEMPLPMPRSVICSPSHMRKAVPLVRVIMVMILKDQPGWMTIISPPTGAVMDSRPMLMNSPWTRLSTTVA